MQMASTHTGRLYGRERPSDRETLRCMLNVLKPTIIPMAYARATFASKCNCHARKLHEAIAAHGTCTVGATCINVICEQKNAISVRLGEHVRYLTSSAS